MTSHCFMLQVAIVMREVLHMLAHRYSHHSKNCFLQLQVASGMCMVL